MGENVLWSAASLKWINSYLIFHLFSLYYSTKTERTLFQSHRYELYFALTQQNGCEGMYEYRVSNMNSKNVFSVFPLRFFLLYVIWIPISVSKLLHFSRFFITELLKILVYVDIDIYKETVWTFSQAMARYESQRERENWGHSIQSENFCLLGEHD